MNARAAGWLELVVLQGSPMARWHLRDQSPVTLGSAGNADLQLDDPFVSQAHGKLELRDRIWYYVDLGSKNGSFLYREGQVSRVHAGEPATAIAAGDALRLGSTLIGVREGGSTPEATRGVTPEITASRSFEALSERDTIPGSARPMVTEPLDKVDAETASGEAVLDTTVQVMIASFPAATRAVAVQLDPTGTRPLRHASTSTQGLSSEVLGLGASMIQRLATGKHVILIRDERVSGANDARGRNCLCAPLHIADGTKGVLLVERTGASSFLDSDFDLLARIAGHAALVLSAVALRELRSREHDSAKEAAMAGHDFGNGLTAVLGALGFLAETELNAPQREAVADAMLAVRWLVNLNRTFLDLWQMESGHLAPTMRDVNLMEEIGQCLALVRRLFEMQNIRLATDVGRELIVRADPDFFRRVLLNFLGNASRHAPEGSTVTITARREDDRVKIGVHDHGPGIAPEVLPHIFERQITGPRPGMMGIGLVFCKLAVERMGGTVAVDSSPGAGSSFYFVLEPAGPGELERTP